MWVSFLNFERGLGVQLLNLEGRGEVPGVTFLNLMGCQVLLLNFEGGLGFRGHWLG